jgi:VWFA-related protein
MRSAAALLLGFLVSLPSPVVRTARAQAGQSAEDSVDLGTTEVVVDVVVKDKDGRVVTGLTPGDFVVSEDDVEQELTSARFASGPGVALSDSPIGVSCIALVFDRLSPESRIRAREAALKLVGDGTRDDLFGVFGIDLSMRVAQPFTYDKARVREALERLSGETSTSFPSNQQLARDLADRQASLQTALASQRTPTGQVDNPAAFAASIGGIGEDLQATSMTLRSIETLERLESSEQGFATTNGLLSVVAALATLPGRKALVFFSEGIDLPTNVVNDFQAVIANANRVNVSIYTVDAAGLRAVSQIGETAQTLTRNGGRRIDQNARGSAPLGGAMMRGLERNEELLRAAPEHSLGELANATGGIFVNNTNDPGAKLRQVDEDLRAHYVLTYVPKDRTFDGRFRKIGVKVRRSGVEVQARKGYFALDAAGLNVVLPAEVRPLAALLDGKATGKIHPRLAGLCFPEPSRPGLAQVFVEAPMREFATQADGKNVKADFTIVALVRDANRRIVEKLSNHYRLASPAAKADELRTGEVLFYREATLPPGVYTVEAIAYDVLSGESGVRRVSLTVPAASDLRMSSVVVVDRAESLTAEDRKVPNPLQVGETLLYPNLGAPVSRSKDGKLSFFTTVYAKSGEVPKLGIDVLRNGRPIASLPAELPAADADGKIRFANALPLEPFPPGVYELRLTATEGSASVSRAATFVVGP